MSGRRHAPSDPTVAVDLDGTLISCAERQLGVAGAVLPAGWSERFDPVRFWNSKREGENTFQALVSLGMEAAEARRCAEAWIARIEDPEWLALDRVLPGVDETLALLLERGIAITLLTARRDAIALDRQLRALGLKPLLGAVWVVDPGNAAAAKAELLRQARPALFVGDSESDLAAAVRADVPFAGVDTGQRSARFLRQAGVQRVSPSLFEAVGAFVRPDPDRAQNQGAP